MNMAKEVFALEMEKAVYKVATEVKNILNKTKFLCKIEANGELIIVGGEETVSFRPKT